jgi:hypothetical protein
MPERSPVPCVVTIHDCTFFDHPEWHLRSKAAFFRRAIRRAALRAGVLVCVSQDHGERACAPVRCAGADRGGAPRGGSPRFTPNEPAEGADRAVLAGVGSRSDRPWSPSSARSSPARGWPRWWPPSIRWRIRPDAVLVLGGQTAGAWRRPSGRWRRPATVTGSLRTGYLPDEAVPALLRQAAVVAYPALEEGFGLPALEALACGAPLVTTEGTAMAEMARGAAQLVHPETSAPLAEALAGALGREGRTPGARRRKSLGISVAAEHTWEASVAAHVRAYHGPYGPEVGFLMRALITGGKGFVGHWLAAHLKDGRRGRRHRHRDRRRRRGRGPPGDGRCRPRSDLPPGGHDPRG